MGYSPSRFFRLLPVASAYPLQPVTRALCRPPPISSRLTFDLCYTLASSALRPPPPLPPPALRSPSASSPSARPPLSLAVLCCAVLRCDVPCCAVPCCAVLRVQGQWFYASDTTVRPASQQQALNAQAYLLFYQRA